MKPCGRVETASSSERGAALVEFALVSLVLYLLIGAVIELGRMVFAAQLAQTAARTAARELAVAPLPASMTLEEALEEPLGQAIYDDDLLVIDLASIPGDLSLQDVASLLPPVNRILLPMMISDRIGGADVLRFPGALVASTNGGSPPPLNPTGLTVKVPRVLGRDADGVETIDFVDVVEEILADPDDPLSGAFSVDSTLATDGIPDNDFLIGVAAVRINIPVQAASLTGFQSGDDPFAPNGNDVILADDAGVTVVGDAPGGFVEGENITYSGPYGLGRQFALGREVRPFRRLIRAQAVFRREVFAEQATP